MTTTISNEAWDEYGELLSEELHLYYNMQSERNPSVGRVYPRNVAKAEKEWERAARVRQERAGQLALTLQVPRSKVSLLYYQQRLQREADGK